MREDNGETVLVWIKSLYHQIRNGIFEFYFRGSFQEEDIEEK
jgi:hypothetical protein